MECIRQEVRATFRKRWMRVVALTALGGVLWGQEPGESSQATGAAQEAAAKGFFGRFADFYTQDWKPAAEGASSAPAPARRGPASPLDSPPFPNSDWSYGGSPVIGEPDTQSYPLMTAVLGADGVAKARSKVYGWVEPTVNASTSVHSNYPETNDIYARRLELNQAVVYWERLPDTVQNTHVDWGYHLTAFYGTDYRSTTNKGYFSGQLINDHHQYGFDPVLEYLDVYLPVKQGMNVRVGRFISVPGIEAQLTPNNYFFSHSLLYAVDPFTDTGVIATLKLTDKWLVQAGITGGHDVAWWSGDAKPSATVCLDYTTASVNDNFYGCANGINDGKYAFNNVQQYDVTWYHRFSKTVHMATETYYMYQTGVPAVGGPVVAEAGTNGAVCAAGAARCTAPEYAAVNYVLKELGPHDFVGFRSDFLNDQKGQRTGFATKYTENTLAYSHWVGTTIQTRAGVRFDRAWDRKAYDVGTRQSQFTFNADVIVHF